MEAESEGLAVSIRIADFDAVAFMRNGDVYLSVRDLTDWLLESRSQTTDAVAKAVFTEQIVFLSTLERGQA